MVRDSPSAGRITRRPCGPGKVRVISPAIRAARPGRVRPERIGRDSGANPEREAAKGSAIGRRGVVIVPSSPYIHASFGSDDDLKKAGADGSCVVRFASLASALQSTRGWTCWAATLARTVLLLRLRATFGLVRKCEMSWLTRGRLLIRSAAPNRRQEFERVQRHGSSHSLLSHERLA
jgi:hypothetical protein